MLGVFIAESAPQRVGGSPFARAPAALLDTLRLR